MAENLATLQALCDALDPELEGALLQVPMAEAVTAMRVRFRACLGARGRRRLPPRAFF